MSYESDIYALNDIFEQGNRNNTLLQIPEYQRNYKWGSEQVERLIKNFLTSFHKIETNENKTSFLGSIIFCKSKGLRNFSNFDVVDGQQRLTTLTIFFIRIYSELKKYEKDFENDLEKCPQWIKNEVKTLKDKLEDFIFLKHRTSGNILTKIPRLIRQFDKRTINHRDSTYRSLIANLINQFRSSIDNNKPFNFNLNSHEGLEKQSIDQASQKIKNLLEEIDNEKYYEKLDCEFVSYKKLFKHNYLELLNSKEYPDIENFKSNKIRTFQKFMKILFFSNFILKKCKVSEIICEQIEDAYDIFDTLNTTGVPLPSIETLKPLIILYYSKKEDQSYNQSKAKMYFDDLETRFTEEFTDAKKQLSESKEIMILTALYLDGQKLSGDLSTQREKIKKYQTDVQKLNKPDYLIETIAKITNYKIDFYLNQSDDIDSKLRDLNDNEISLIKIFRKLFKELNTYLSLPSLVRLYENGDFKLYFNFFKALTAFFVLRRSATIETDQIDNIFRNLMFGQNKLDFCGLKTNLDKSNELPDLNIIKNYLINNLNNSKVNFNLESKKEWVSHMINVPIYDRKILSKFLLFAAYNNTITEEKTGLVTRRGATPDISRSFLKFENFQSKIYETVEHVAPQSPNNPDSWKGIYSENKVNSIGNLILIPKLQNINLSNHNWSVKKPFLKAMSTSNIDERKKLFKEASDAGLNLSAQRINYLVNYETSSELLKGLSDTNEWDVNFVKNRSKRLLELAWDELAKWLKPEKK